ncbi:hypothetical protein V8C35DRAFT_76228 [Trichoderma chlorosporum]
MDWNSCQNLEMMFLSDDDINMEAFMDPNFFKDDSFDESLAAAASNYDNSIQELFGIENSMNNDNLGFLSQDVFQFLPTDNAFPWEGIDAYSGIVNEIPMEGDAAPTPSAWSSSNTAPSPTDKFLSVSPFGDLNYQISDISSHIDDQIESFRSPMPITPMNHQMNPTDNQKQRRRRKQNDTEILKYVKFNDSIQRIAANVTTFCAGKTKGKLISHMYAIYAD